MRLRRLILSCGFGGGHRLEDKSIHHVSCAFGERHRLEDKPIYHVIALEGIVLRTADPLQPQAFRNQNAIEQIEAPLHQQCEQRRRNGALQDCGVIV